MHVKIVSQLYTCITIYNIIFYIENHLGIVCTTYLISTLFFTNSTFFFLVWINKLSTGVAAFCFLKLCQQQVSSVITKSNNILINNSPFPFDIYFRLHVLISSAGHPAWRATNKSTCEYDYHGVFTSNYPWRGFRFLLYDSKMRIITI